MAYDLMLENRHFKDINPLICGWEECESGHSFGPSVRDCILIHYVCSGHGIFEAPTGSYEVKKGQMFVIHPGEVTFYKADSATPWKYIWVGFKSTIALPDCFEKSVINADGCGHIFMSLAQKRENDGTNELFVLGKIYELLSVLCAGDSGTSLTQSYVNRAKNYIKNNYMQEMSIDNIAKQLGLDRSYFCRIFAKSEGVPPSQYLMRLRLSHAAEMLSEKSCTPSQAAMACGYFDTVNFSRMFKRQYGVPPSKYKRGTGVS